MGGIGIAFLAFFLIVCNIVFDIILAVRFKKMISGKKDETIEAAKHEMDLIIADMNRQTDRNITLFQEHQRELKAILAEADRRVTVAKNELARQEQSKQFMQQLQQGTVQRAPVSHERSRTSQLSSRRAAERYMQSVPPVAHQGDLFEDNQDSFEPNVFTVSRDGAAYTAMPVIGPNVNYVDDPIHVKKDFGTQVRELYDKGDSVEDIATALGRSTTEVQFALDMNA